MEVLMFLLFLPWVLGIIGIILQVVIGTIVFVLDRVGVK